MTYEDMLDRLALRIEDPDKNMSDAYKGDALHNAQVLVPLLLHESYLTELEEKQSNASLSTGVLSLDNLTYDVLKGTEGVIDVKNYGGLYCTKLTIDDIKRTENSLYEGSKQNPMWYVFANAIRTLPITLTNVDVFYLRMPAIFEHPFTCSASNPAAADTFIADADQNLSLVDDTYNNHVIYNTEHSAYFKVTDYTYDVDITVTVSPSLTGEDTFGTGTFYFATGDFGLCNTENMTCILNAALHELVIDFAEVECWSNLKRVDRSLLALKKALSNVQSLNDMRVKKIESDIAKQ